jgi:predicted ATP-grasp superfamily ATP-dependent carboligase
MGNVIAARFDLVGLFGVDFVRTPGGLFPLEVNPRYTASVEVLERVTQVPLVAWHVAACLRGELPGDSPLAAGYAGKAIVYARQSCRWIGSLHELAPSAWPELADVPRPGAGFERGQPIATVYATGTRASDVLHELRRREQDALARFVAPVST